MENVLRIKEEEIKNETVSNIIYKLFWVYIICGVAGFGIETIWCWIDFQEFSSRSSDIFFPISWVWGVGGVMLYLFTVKNRWNHSLYIFAKCTVLGAAFEFLCGYLGEKILEVTFWDYSGMPLHIGRYINIPFCLFWGLLGIIWVKKICPVIDRKLRMPSTAFSQWMLRAFLIFIIFTQLLTGVALLRMHARQQGRESRNYIEYILDCCFNDQLLHSFFPKMKPVVPIYLKSVVLV